MMVGKEYRLRFVRHVRSESNEPTNKHVHWMDPLVLQLGTEKTWPGHQEGKPGTGRELAQGELASKFQVFDTNGTQPTHIIVSPLARTLQTFLLAVPYETLKKAKVWVRPEFMEQTIWFSDRCRHIDHIKALISKELELRETPRGERKLTLEDLDIDLSKLEGEANQPWHLKDCAWSPENLIERGKAATQFILHICREARKQNKRDYTVCVFGHGGFINYMAVDIGMIKLNKNPPDLTDWAVGEIRDFIIKDADLSKEPVPCLLEETVNCRKARFPEHWRRHHGDNVPAPENGVIPVPDPIKEAVKRQELQQKIVQMAQEILGGNQISGEDKRLYLEAAKNRKIPEAVYANNLEYVVDVASKRGE